MIAHTNSQTKTENNHKLTNEQRINIFLQLLDYKKSLTNRSWGQVGALCLILAFVINSTPKKDNELFLCCLYMITSSSFLIAVLLHADIKTLKRVLNSITQEKDLSEKSILPLFDDAFTSVFLITLYGISSLLVLSVLLVSSFWAQILTALLVLLVIIFLIRQRPWGTSWKKRK